MFKACAAISTALLLTACGSNVNYTDVGQTYFESEAAKYSEVQVSINSENEIKATGAGYMSNTEVENYVGNKIKDYLNENDLNAKNIVDVKMNIRIERIYSWGGTSIAKLSYYADVNLVSNGEQLGYYNRSGTVSDQSVGGNFNTIFAKNDANDEPKYIDSIINYILEDLPTKQL